MKPELIKNKIKTIDSRSLVDKAETQLIELLKTRSLNVGDTIPKELELCELLGVSRTVVREALSRLRIMGLIESRKKRGSVIISPDIFKSLSNSLNPYILSNDTLKDLFELRLVLEMGVADLLFLRITPQDLKELHDIVNAEPSQTDNSIFDPEYEIRFHGKLYDISGNESLKNFQKLLYPVFTFVHASVLIKKSKPSKNFVSHKMLVNILENGTPEEFRKGMRDHLENHFRRINV